MPVGTMATACPSPDHFGFIGAIFSLDVPASSELTRKQLDWHAVRPGLMAGLDDGHHFNH